MEGTPPAGNDVGVWLAGHRVLSTDESDDLARMTVLVGRHDAWTRDGPLHFTGSAFVVHPSTRRVLLRWHTRQAAWIQVGGHADPDEHDPLAVARREAEEETSLVDLVPWPEARLLHAVIVPVPANEREPAHEHADLRFVLATEFPEAARPENPSGQLRWLSLAEVRALTSKDNVRESLRRIEVLFDDTRHERTVVVISASEPPG
jgi:8-oxo-dGTP pyrophosphatase MutT (NUDIX family)